MAFNCLAIGCDGFVGSILRHLVDNAVTASSFPWATLAVNVVGSFALAAIAGIALSGIAPNGGLPLGSRRWRSRAQAPLHHLAWAACLDDLNDPSITTGGLTGSVHEPFIAKVLPRAQEKQFNTLDEMIAALESGEIDAFVHAKDNILSTMEEAPGRLRMIDEPVGEAMVGMAISPRTEYPELKSQLNAFLKEMKESGELDEMHQRWMVDKRTEMPDVPVSEDPAETLVVGTSGKLVPNSYYQDGELVGHDIELTLRFANKYNYAVEFRPESIDEMLNDAESGQVDMLSGGIGETPERAKRVIFPDTPLYGNTINAVVLAD